MELLYNMVGFVIIGVTVITITVWVLRLWSRWLERRVNR